MKKVPSPQAQTAVRPSTHDLGIMYVQVHRKPIVAAVCCPTAWLGCGGR